MGADQEMDSGVEVFVDVAERAQYASDGLLSADEGVLQILGIPKERRPCARSCEAGLGAGV
jgi:hypothetical protein